MQPHSSTVAIGEPLIRSSREMLALVIQRPRREAAPHLRLRMLLACVWSVFAGFSGLRAQATTRVPSPPVCARCDIELETLVSVGGPLDEVTIHPMDIAVRDPRGHVFVGHVNDGMLSLFNPQGKFVRSIGRKGGGPGEYQVILGLVPDRDTLHVFDAANARHTVLSDRFAVVREVPIPPAVRRNQMQRLADGRWLLGADIRTPALAGVPLHVLNDRGSIVQSFGNNEPTLLRADPSAILRVFAAGADATTWLGHVTQYRVERWTLSGSLRSVFVREPDWFIRNSQWDGIDGSPPPSALSHLWEDPKGRLWVFLNVAAPNWQEGVTPVKRGTTVIALQMGDPAKIYDTVIEVIDPANGRLLVSRRYDLYVSSVQPDGTVMASRQDADGNTYLTFLRATLSEPPPQR